MSTLECLGRASMLGPARVEESKFMRTWCRPAKQQAWKQTCTGKFQPTSPDLTLNAGSFREQYQNGLKLGIQIVPNYPE